MTLATASPQDVTISLSRYPMQGRFVGSRAHEAGFVGGIGSGKTWAGCIRALSASQGIVGKRAVLQTPNIGVITAPTYGMLRDATLAPSWICRPGGDEVESQRNVATMRNGWKCCYHASDGQVARAIHLVVGDERLFVNIGPMKSCWAVCPVS